MMKMNWFYACSFAMALGALSFATVSCSDDDDKAPVTGEVVETPKPVVEYYIVGTLTDKGERMKNTEVKVDKVKYETDKNGQFFVTVQNTGTFAIEATPEGYIAQKTSVEIAANADNRSVVTVDLAMTKLAKAQKVKADEGGKIKDTSAPDLSVTEPEDIREDQPIATVELDIPAGALPEESIGTDGSANISVTPFVPTPEVKAEEEELSGKQETKLPLAAINFEPTGLTFKKPVTITINNPFAGITFVDGMTLTYLNKKTGKWEEQTDKSVITDEKGNYQAKIDHFSSYAVENKVSTKVEAVTVDKKVVLGSATKDNSENYNAVKDIVLKYKEKSGWECTDATIKSNVEKALENAPAETVNAMVAFFKTRLYLLMGSSSGIIETERTYNTVNVNGYSIMKYTCYAKTRLTTLSVKVKYNNKEAIISVPVKCYVGADHQYSVVSNTHSGGQGGSI